jgi:2-oxo-4-hydroxy-4-carboxy-5-ureidoimidazoline decarboxylase
VTTGARQRDALRRGNDAYEARFGHVFLICASGLDTDQLLRALSERLANPPELEFATATGEQRKIAALRLRGLLSA